MGITLVCENLSELRVFRLYAMAQLNPSAFTGLQRRGTSEWPPFFFSQILVNVF